MPRIIQEEFQICQKYPVTEKKIYCILDLKSGFFDANDALRENLLRINSVYAAQPLRENCKICNNLLPVSGGFAKQGVAYVICPCCGHLNGCHEDTDAFCVAVYSDNGGVAYGKNYTNADAEAYHSRVREIYEPKARFLADALTEHVFPASLRFADLGAGSGYFVSALQECGFESVMGYEVSESQINFARQMNPRVKMTAHQLDDICGLAGNIEADVVSMIGVLEHLREPRAVLDAICTNPNVQYLYISVPLFSPSVVFEALFPEVMPRQLAGGHTHLFSEASLEYMAKEFGLESVAEWWFGTDMMDLFRSVIVQIKKTPDMSGLQDFATQSLLASLDELQMVFDRKHLSSEVHMVYKVRH